MTHHSENAVCDLGHFQRLFRTMFPSKLGHSLYARRENVPELTQNAADHVHDLGALSDDQIPCSMDGENSLLILGFDLNKAHGGAAHRFADRFGVGRVCLAALYIGFDIGRWHQTNIMAELAQFATPVMC